MCVQVINIILHECQFPNLDSQFGCRSCSCEIQLLSGTNLAVVSSAAGQRLKLTLFCSKQVINCSNPVTSVNLCSFESVLGQKLHKVITGEEFIEVHLENGRELAVPVKIQDVSLTKIIVTVNLELRQTRVIFIQMLRSTLTKQGQIQCTYQIASNLNQIIILE
ncbi:Hypothetical_protein [Hexamita inflata]|uniref:Hypothetical_protein n=1 Tax=Hexamita inflata TaxID=28002 RepID=A0ABP1IZW3_9EUKA